jgi:hypothetical protein
LREAKKQNPGAKNASRERGRLFDIVEQADGALPRPPILV